jgi:mannitol-specific phosphotransferase system IIBC component
VSNENQDLGWAPGPALVALGILGLIGAITVSAIFHYSSVDDALKFWAALSGIVGVVTGAFVAFFFTRATVQAAQQGAQTAQQSAEALRGVAEKAQEQATNAEQNAQVSHRALATAMNLVDDAEMSRSLRNDPTIRRALRLRDE